MLTIVKKGLNVSSLRQQSGSKTMHPPGLMLPPYHQLRNDLCPSNEEWGR
jgi:hypothetical protein